MPAPLSTADLSTDALPQVASLKAQRHQPSQPPGEPQPSPPAARRAAASDKENRANRLLAGLTLKGAAAAEEAAHAEAARALWGDSKEAARPLQPAGGGRLVAGEVEAHLLRSKLESCRLELHAEAKRRGRQEKAGKRPPPASCFFLIHHRQ